MVHVRRASLVGVASVVTFGMGAAAHAQPLTRDTLKPLLIADVNALQANRYFLQSMIALNSTPFTIGYGTQQARVDYLRIDGAVVPGSLSKDQFVLSAGYGRPATGFAMYGVLNFVGATAGNFPKPPMTNINSIAIRATNASVVAALGLAYKGWVLQASWHYHELRVHADQYGRLTSCGDEGFGCPQNLYPSRPGAPEPILLDSNKETASSRMIMLENKGGYSAGAIFADFAQALPDGTREHLTRLAALRVLAQPNAIFEKLGSFLGVGLNTYARQLDYYGDKLKARQDAAREQKPPPQNDKGIVEIPLLADHIAKLGFIGRIVLQAYPKPLPRLAEIGYLHAGNEVASFVPHVGARAKVFRRGDEAAFSCDAYAGFFFMTSRSTQEHEGRGFSVFGHYSYNSPDASTFVPLPDSHVIGLQLVWGNPAALAPPIPSVRVPKSATYEGGAS